jgi:hypothetical protein
LATTRSGRADELAVELRFFVGPDGLHRPHTLADNRQRVRGLVPWLAISSRSQPCRRKQEPSTDRVTLATSLASVIDRAAPPGTLRCRV